MLTLVMVETPSLALAADWRSTAGSLNGAISSATRFALRVLLARRDSGRRAHMVIRGSQPPALRDAADTPENKAVFGDNSLAIWSSPP